MDAAGVSRDRSTVAPVSAVGLDADPDAGAPQRGHAGAVNWWPQNWQVVMPNPSSG